MYSIDIDGRGHRARWSGSPEDGSPQRTVRITDADLRELERQLASSRFFERDERGMLPLKTECTSDGTTTTCSIGARISVCSDTSHAIITVTRGRRENTVDYDFCDDNPDLVDLSRLIERIARTRAAEP